MGTDVSNKTENNIKKMMADSDISYAMAQVERYMPDRYRLLPFLSDDVRPLFITMQALRVELSKIRLRITEPIMGQIRLKWWVEAVENITQGQGQVADHPIIRLLAPMIGQGGINPDRVIDMITAHEIEVEHSTPENMDELYAHGHGMEAGAFNMITPMPEGLPGILGVTRFLMEFDTRAGSGLCPVPRDKIRQAGLALADFQSGDDTVWADVKQIILTIAQDAIARLNTLNPTGSSKLIGTLANQQLKSIIKQDGNVLHPKVGIIPPFLFLKLTWAAWTNG